MTSFFKKAQRHDRLANIFIRIGGLFVVFAIVGIFVQIATVILPLFKSGKAQLITTVSQPPAAQGHPQAIGIDDYLENAYLIDQAGQFFTIELNQQTWSQAGNVKPEGLEPDATIDTIQRLEANHYLITWSNGTLSQTTVDFTSYFDSKDRHIDVTHSNRTLFTPSDFSTIATTNLTATNTTITDITLPKLWRANIVKHETDTTTLLAAHLDHGLIYLLRQQAEENLLGEVAVTKQAYLLQHSPTALLDLILLPTSQELIALNNDGHLLRWRVDDTPEFLEEKDIADQQPASLTPILGGQSFVVASNNKTLSLWFNVRTGEQTTLKRLERIRTLPTQDAAILQLIPTEHNRMLYARTAADRITLIHTTSTRQVLDLSTGNKIVFINSNHRGNGLAALTGSGLSYWQIDTPHADISFQTLFKKVWYEGYDAPVYAWQSSSASNDFEPKLSLIPLISGTLKATFYAMLFSIPLALFAAVYANQFLSQRLHNLLKPIIEMMAAFPSVVIGFMAALWFAPLLENTVITFFLSLLTIPLILLLWLSFWQQLLLKKPQWLRIKGLEYICLIPMITLAVYLSHILTPAIETLFFGGNFNHWLYTTLQTSYDQRNSIVIAFALGFAVIPIIFTITDDALSSVPKSLAAASLAVGASRWQTVWKVILPSASPGIFAALMIGLGRAIGETMIVLMAAGNTPLLDWSIFNGMRTLSANIAVEIPEAPQGGTLYRILFLSALLLFMLTFVVNTIAEIVRSRLRKKYARF